MTTQSNILSSGDIIKTDESIRVAGTFGPFYVLEQKLHSGPVTPPTEKDKIILGRHFIVVDARKTGNIVLNSGSSEPEYQEVTAHESDAEGKVIGDGLRVKFYQTGVVDRIPYKNLVEQPIVVGKAPVAKADARRFDW
jgi:hypothetical protein